METDLFVDILDRILSDMLAVVHSLFAINDRWRHAKGRHEDRKRGLNASRVRCLDEGRVCGATSLSSQAGQVNRQDSPWHGNNDRAWI